MNNNENPQLELWQDRLEAGQTAYQQETGDLSALYKLYDGTITDIDPVTDEEAKNGGKKKARILRNIVKEIIESEVSTAIPMPKVTALRDEDEDLAKIIEDFLRDEIDRINMEELNDIQERLVPIYGASAWSVEWDNTKRTHSTVGASTVSIRPPQQIVPQPGITTSIQDMDWCIVKVPSTKTAVSRKFGVDLEENATEEEPAIRTGDGSAKAAEDMVTVYYGYYRNASGGIGLYAWCLDTELADYDDYQARRVRVCTKCGALESDAAKYDGNEDEPTCKFCGGKKWKETQTDTMTLSEPPIRTDGTPIFDTTQRTVETGTLGADGLPLLTVEPIPQDIPYYVPNMYPVQMQRNVSILGNLLGESDAKAIRTQQNAINRINYKIAQKAIQPGSAISRPAEVTFAVDGEEGNLYTADNPALLDFLKKFDFSFDVSQEIALQEHYYEQARQLIGITDSFQGRTDKTAQSGKAKEFAAAQTAGRLESKRKNKEAAFQGLYEMLFKFALAYADEPRPVRRNDPDGSSHIDYFNKWDFLNRDDDGTWWWNDDFLFSCDTATPLANNREAMWQETRANFASGAFGDPASIDTLILFWEKMELLHYPGAGETKTHLEALKEEQIAAAQRQAAEAAAMQQNNAENDIIAQARNDARADAERENARPPRI